MYRTTYSDIKYLTLSDAQTVLTSKFDIGLHSNYSTMEDQTRYQLLTSPWIPPQGYRFKSTKDLKQNRRFQSAWLDRYRWLSYSDLQQGAFCRVCVLFCGPEVGKGQHARTGALVSKPFQKWKQALEIFDAHESTKYHRDCQLAADNFIQTFLGNAPSVVDQLDQGRQNQIRENRRKLQPVVETVLFCARQGLALRGHRDSGPLDLSAVSAENEGNFRALLRMRADCGDTALKDHLEGCPSNASYLSPAVQNQIIEISGEVIKERLVAKVNASGCFAVLADETTDIAGIEQLTVCARYLNKDTDNIEEVFLGFVPIQDQSGRALADTIIKFLIDLGINMQHLRGQGYDGASSMAGRTNGVQAVVREKYPTALYTHCASHSLNLVLCAACSITDIRNCFGTLKKTSIFFRKSANRSHVLRKMISLMCPESTRQRLLGLCETRWVEKHDAVLSFVSLFEAVIAALEEIQDNGSGESSAQANSLALALLSPAFLVSLHVAKNVLALTLPLSKRLQSSSIDMSAAMDDLHLVQETIQNDRDSATASFSKIFAQVQAVANKMNVEITSRRAGVRQQDRGVALENPEQYFRRTVFIPFMDYVLAQLHQRFEKHRTTLECFCVIVPSAIPPLQDNREKAAENLVASFPQDVDARAALGELRLWWAKWMNKAANLRPSTGITALSHCDCQFYPNVHKLLQILVTLPVTTATAERTFSSMRLLKNYLRSTMSQERMVGLALLYAHRDVDVSVSEVIDRFAKIPRRVSFVL